MRCRKSLEMGSQVRQGEQKTKEISECERKIQKIKTMRGEIALAHGVFQQPVKVLKSEIEIGPVYHRLPQRIRAHAAICFMALILYRVMRAKLRAGDTKLSPERALDKLRRIQHQKIVPTQGKDH